MCGSGGAGMSGCGDEQGTLFPQPQSPTSPPHSSSRQRRRWIVRERRLIAKTQQDVGDDPGIGRRAEVSRYKRWRVDPPRHHTRWRRVALANEFITQPNIRNQLIALLGVVGCKSGKEFGAWTHVRNLGVERGHL